MGDSDTGERDNEECSMLCNQEPNSDSPEMDVEARHFSLVQVKIIYPLINLQVTSNDEQICEMPVDAANMDETVDENEGAQNQVMPRLSY
ncbi:unnamed protein product [Cylicostephanus goldi]|uniref:Uncharacterized protein n=1 Tax=Cylicostephanus goldi TaxID=71465 RepID=A0A3P7QEB8_CYLGO|nr:unnamed protein product [Cylicostephanus goldi]